MTNRITTTDLIEHRPDILLRVEERGEQFVIECDGRPLATIAPAAGKPDITWKEFVARLAGVPRPDDRFADDLEVIHSSQRWIEPPEWPT